MDQGENNIHSASKRNRETCSNPKPCDSQNKHKALNEIQKIISDMTPESNKTKAHINFIKYVFNKTI